MTTPLPQLLDLVATLNDPANPFTYEVEGDSIVGKWDIVSAKSLYPTEFTSIDKKFSVTVHFDEKKGTFKPKERSSESSTSVGSDGKIGLSFGSSSFSGKSTSKGASFEFGGVSKKKGEDASLVLAYSWDTAKIKKPLFDFLESNGWKRKRGLFG
jgi:hypothetical protein